MKMSSRRSGLEGGSVTQHRPHYVDPATRQRDEGLSVPLTLRPLAVVERPGLWRSTEAGEGRLVEYALEDLVPSSHPSVVTDPLTGVISGGHQPSVGSESVSTLEGRKVSYSDQKLRSKKRSHTRQTSEDWCLRAGEKALPELLVDALDARSLRERISPASSATMREARSSAGRVTLWDLAAVSALCATILNPLTRRFLR
jgi:hypothetical protein